MIEKFYVYEHWRPDRDEPFYVGKGTRNRASVMYNRNRHHKRVQRELASQGMCLEIRMVAEGLSETAAFALECERIANWIRQGIALCNMTVGGEGNADPLPETRAKMRAAKVGRKLTDEHKRKIAEATRRALADPEVKAKLSAALKRSLNDPEVKAKRSRSQKARVRTKEHYEKVAAALRGRKRSPESIAKTRAANLGRKQSREEIEHRRLANKGKVRTEEFRERMKALWTPERRAIQAKETAARSAQMNEIKRILRLIPTDEDK